MLLTTIRRYKFASVLNSWTLNAITSVNLSLLYPALEDIGKGHCDNLFRGRIRVVTLPASHWERGRGYVLSLSGGSPNLPEVFLPEQETGCHLSPDRLSNTSCCQWQPARHSISSLPIIWHYEDSVVIHQWPAYEARRRRTNSGPFNNVTRVFLSSMHTGIFHEGPAIRSHLSLLVVNEEVLAALSWSWKKGDITDAGFPSWCQPHQSTLSPTQAITKCKGAL